MEQQSISRVTTSGSGSLVVHIDARPAASHPVDRLSWCLDSTGRELIEREDFREELAQLLTWPGRVSGWRRAAHVWTVDTASGGTYIFGVDGAPWPRPGIAPVDPAAIVGAGTAGAPPTLRSVKLIDRREVLVVAAMCLASGAGSVCEVTVAPSLPTVALLAEHFPAGHSTDDGFMVGGEPFDPVHAASVYTIDTGGGFETAVLLADAIDMPRAWIRAESCATVTATMGISSDNSRVGDSRTASVRPLSPADQLGEMRRAVIAALSSNPR